VKKLIAIVFILLFGKSFGQHLPTYGLCLSDVLAVTGGSCLADAFTNANSTYFDPAYAVAGGNYLDDFRNYGPTACTRPGGLYTVTFYSKDNGVVVTSGNACGTWYPCTSGCISVVGQTTGYEGADVYSGTGTDCTKLADGYYVVATGGDTYTAVHIVSGVLHYVPC